MLKNIKKKERIKKRKYKKMNISNPSKPKIRKTEIVKRD